MLLESIPDNRRKNICTIHRGFGGSIGTQRTYLDLLEVREAENAAIFMAWQFQRNGYARIPGGVRIHIPLDQIGTISTQQDGDWCMTVKGKFEVLGGQPVYTPL